MKRLLLIFAVILSLIPLNGQSSSADTFDQQSSAWPLDSFINDSHTFYEELKIFHDRNGNISFEEVQKNDSLFSNNTTSENFQADDVYWAKLILQGNCRITANYLFGFASILKGQGWQYNDTWLVREDSSITQQQSGFGLSKQEKSIHSATNLARFEIKQNEKVTLYVRYKGAMKDK